MQVCVAPLAPILSVPMLIAVTAADRHLALRLLRHLATWLVWPPGNPRLRAVVHLVALSTDYPSDLRTWATRYSGRPPFPPASPERLRSDWAEHMQVMTFRVAMLRFLPLQAILATGPDIFLETMPHLPLQLRDSFLVDLISLADDSLQDRQDDSLDTPLHHARAWARLQRASYAPPGLCRK